MKKTIFILLLVVPCTSFSQVYKLRVFKTILAEYDGNDWKDKETNKVDFLAVLNLDKDKIQTYGQETTDFDLVKLKDRELKEDGDIVSHYDAVDKKGNQCDITFYLFSKGRQEKEDSPLASFAVRYQDTLLIFYMKKDE